MSAGGALRRAAVVFDLDGTLVDSRLDFAALREEVRALLAARGLPWLGLSSHEPALAELLTWARDHASGAAPAAYAEAMARVEAAERVGHAARAMPGAAPVLRRLRAAGARLGVLTNNARAGSIAQMQRLGLDALVDVVVTRDDVPALKPDPRGLAMTFARLDDRSVRFFVGDSWIDAAAAQALGVPFVALGLAPDVVAGHGLAPVAWHAGSLDEALRVIEQAAAAAAKDGQAPPGQREGRACRDG